jgi:hypothetical protein
MKKQAVRYLSAFVLICLALAATVGLNRSLRANMHRQLQYRIAYARTLTAAVRYLLAPELPDFQSNPADGEASATKLAKTAARPESRVAPSAPQLPSLTTSNGVAAAQTDTPVPG